MNQTRRGFFGAIAATAAALIFRARIPIAPALPAAVAASDATEAFQFMVSKLSYVETTVFARYYEPISYEPFLIGD